MDNKNPFPPQSELTTHAPIAGIAMQEALERLLGDHDLLVQVARAMCVDFNSNRDLLVTKVNQKDSAWLYDFFHKVKGVAGNLAAIKIRDAACNAEKEVKAGEFDKALVQVEIIQCAFDELQASLVMFP